MIRLDEVDLSFHIPKAQAEERLIEAQRHLLELRLRCGGQLRGHDGLGPPVLIVFEGWDASGKGGAIKRLVAPLDPRHVKVATFAAPTADEKRHQFLLRFGSAIPGWGGMSVLDRSWYGRVLVERVEGFATTVEWSRAYAEIVNYEQGLVDEGAIIIKFWMHLSQEDQLKRFKEREKDVLKQWKITAEDWRNRERWDDYAVAVQEMLDRTDRPGAPWVVVPAADKRTSRTLCVETVVEGVRTGLKSKGLSVPH
jgi:AMP-polyphosphate phosphotransferase